MGRLHDNLIAAMVGMAPANTSAEMEQRWIQTVIAAGA